MSFVPTSHGFDHPFKSAVLAEPKCIDRNWRESERDAAEIELPEDWKNVSGVRLEGGFPWQTATLALETVLSFLKPGGQEVTTPRLWLARSRGSSGCSDIGHGVFVPTSHCFDYYLGTRALGGAQGRRSNLG